MKDEQFLINRNDNIDNAVENVIYILLVDPNKYTHNMEITHKITHYAKDLLIEQGLDTCHPWIDEKNDICYSTFQRCKYCTKPSCLNTYPPTPPKRSITPDDKSDSGICKGGS